MTFFDPDTLFNMTADLSLIEAAGIPMMSTLKKYSELIETTLRNRREPKLTHDQYIPGTTDQLLHSWLTEDGKKPPTWRNFLRGVCQLGLNNLAYQVETYLRTGRVKHHPNVEVKSVALKGERKIENNMSTKLFISC